MKKDITDLKQIVYGMLNGEAPPMMNNEQMGNMFNNGNNLPAVQASFSQSSFAQPLKQSMIIHQEAVEVKDEPKEQAISLEKHELELIKKVLDKFRGRRRKAARELGISERTLYRKIKQYGLE